MRVAWIGEKWISQRKLPRYASSCRGREDEHADDPREESSHVRPPGDAAGALRDVEGRDPGEQLHGEPEEQVEDRRNLHDPGKDEDGDEGDDAGAREGDEIRAEDSGDGAGRAHGGDGGLGRERHLAERRSEAAEDVEDHEAEMPELVLD